ncbi:MAG: competence/damage-inducible protein A [Bacteroidota bacterium]
MQAEIISIGDELLIGQVVNTNASWMSEKLNEVAVSVRYITTISDNEEDMMHLLETAYNRSDLVILTGGLGPTKDDKTKDVLVKFFNTSLELNETVLEDIKAYLNKRSVELNELNRNQAMTPKGCEIIRNPEGTAPGLVFKKKDKTVIAVPGVPYEMKHMFDDHIIPTLKKSQKQRNIVHRTVLTQGMAEAMLAEKLEDWENELPEDIKLAYLPSSSTVRLRLSGKGKSREEVKEKIQREIDKLKKIIPDYIYGYDDDTLEKIVIDILSKEDKTLSIAESCTGGYISHLITSVPGSSECFEGSVISYSNNIKEKHLNVPGDLIEKHGAVSSQVAEAMAEGVRKSFKTDYAVSVTGIAGPSGGTKEKPVGLVYIAVAAADNVYSKKYLFGDKRQRNIERSAVTALNMLRKEIKKLI